MTKPKRKITKPDWSRDIRFRFPLVVLIAAFVGLVAHVRLEVWAMPLISKMTANLGPPDEQYPNLIIFMAYATACISVGLVAFLYRHLGQYMPVKKKWQRVLLLAAIVLEIKGDLIRQPVMDFIVNVTQGLETPFQFVVVNQMDKWVANLLLAAIIVYLCPLKKETAKKKA
ncbi:MAG: hypothetical protein ACAH80_11055 [Alphaproteobacteria bacterium]